MYFSYGEKEKNYLKEQDPLLGQVIDLVGHIQRPVNPDLFSSMVHQIVSQQISTASKTTIWNRMEDRLGNITVDSILSQSQEELQSFGITFRKAGYITDFANRVKEGSLDLVKLRSLGDEEVIKELCKINGIGPWTAQMVLIFSMQRPNVISFGDLAIRKGMGIVYGLEKLNKSKFDELSLVYSPYATVAGLYLWAVAGGAVPLGRDPKQINKKF
jgi:DNA-3-methyladenine glycosylase II